MMPQTATSRKANRGPATKETFTRSQGAAISSIYGFIDASGWLTAGWLAGCWLGGWWGRVVPRTCHPFELGGARRISYQFMAISDVLRRQISWNLVWMSSNCPWVAPPIFSKTFTRPFPFVGFVCIFIKMRPMGSHRKSWEESGFGSKGGLGVHF